MNLDIILGDIFAFVVATLVFLIGILFFAHAMKRNPQLAGKFMYNIFAGITGGLVLYMFLSVKITGGDGADYYMITSGAMLFIGVIIFVMTPKIK